jgi:hypothetical protein
MAKINVVHVIGGGVIAGVIINVGGILAWEKILGHEYVTQLGRELPRSAMPRSMFWGYMIAIASTWLYASLRPRYGRGTKTALIVGSMTWFVGMALGNYAFWSLGLIDGRLMLVASAIGLAQMMVATLAGAWVYERRGVDGTGVVSAM